MFFSEFCGLLCSYACAVNTRYGTKVCQISVFYFHGLQVTIGKDGDLSISARFDDVKAMNAFEKDLPNILEDIRKAFLFESTRFCGVCFMSFEREAMSSSVPIETKL